jgi:NADP-dependent 3-hydroxy acid dehydrogenase YdfG
MTRDRDALVLTREHGSIAAYEAYPVMPSYGVAKAGLRVFAVNLRHELASDRIGVTVEGDIHE